MIKNIIIGVLMVLCVGLTYRSHCIEKQHADAIQWAIQNTSDELLTACESRIDELTAEYEDNCADMVEDAVNEILEQF